MNAVTAFIESVIIEAVRVDHLTDPVASFLIISFIDDFFDVFAVIQVDNINHLRLVASAFHSQRRTAFCVFGNFKFDKEMAVVTHFLPADKRTVCWAIKWNIRDIFRSVQ